MLTLVSARPRKCLVSRGSPPASILTGPTGTPLTFERSAPTVGCLLYKLFLGIMSPFHNTIYSLGLLLALCALLLWKARRRRKQ